MKLALIALFTFFSVSSFAGCQLNFSSTEAGKLQRMDGYQEKYRNVSLEDCMNRAEALLGTRVRMEGTMLRGADSRLLTQARYIYSNSRVSTSGTMYLKH